MLSRVSQIIVSISVICKHNMAARVPYNAKRHAVVTKGSTYQRVFSCLHCLEISQMSEAGIVHPLKFNFLTTAAILAIKRFAPSSHSCMPPRFVSRQREGSYAIRLHCALTEATFPSSFNERLWKILSKMGSGILSTIFWDLI